VGPFLFPKRRAGTQKFQILKLFLKKLSESEST